MPTFTATYTNTLGQQRQLKLTAADQNAAKRDLRRRGIAPSSLVAGNGAQAGAKGEPRRKAPIHSSAWNWAQPLKRSQG